MWSPAEAPVSQRAGRAQFLATHARPGRLWAMLTNLSRSGERKTGAWRSRRPLARLLLGGLLAAVSVYGCSDPFESCEQRRRCSPGGAPGTAGSEGGAGGVTAGTSSRDEGGAGGQPSHTPEVGGSPSVDGPGGAGGSGVDGGRSGDAGAAGVGGTPYEGNCSSPSESGCLCILGTTRPCGACEDGDQTCVNGRTGEYSKCVGAVRMPSTWYRDADGDGYGSAVTTTTCSNSRPPGYTDRTGDCCDDGGDIGLAAQIHPGQQSWFETPANLCGIIWDYDCSGQHELLTEQAEAGCVKGATPPACETTYVRLRDDTCGTLLDLSFCYELATMSSSACRTTGTGSMQKCH